MKSRVLRMRARGLSIAFPSSLERHEEGAFAHAVALSLRSKSSLLVLHANDSPDSLQRMPSAVELLKRWGALPEGAREGDETKLGMYAERRCERCCDDPVDTLLGALRKSPPDLLVCPTRARGGLQRVLGGSVAEALALHTDVPTLLIPSDSDSFVSQETGSVHLTNILVPFDDTAAGELGAQMSAWVMDLVDARELEVELLHVAEHPGQHQPEFKLPERPGLRFTMSSLAGPLEETIVRRARERSAHLIVMATHGHDGLRDMLMGSHTERVLHGSPCPVLSVPLRHTAQPSEE
jgi:nucleotide-binding universal stress UspA family protein